jgi:hypothetical protein
MDRLRRRAVIWLVCIGFYHLTLILLTAGLLYYTNQNERGVFSFNDGERNFWVNVALLGFIGSLLYFSRKIYVYLIANKIFRIESEINRDVEQSSDGAEDIRIGRFQSRLAGYYLYLAARPIGGLAIGPIIAMIILSGLTTLSKNATITGSQLSSAGIYIIYVFSFVGGYTSSDMFDYLSKAGGRLFAKTKLE